MFSQVTNCRTKTSGRQCHKYLPDELWLEIFSRLPIRSLFISRSVCKLWRNFSDSVENKIDSVPGYVPVCGLLLLSLGPIDYETDRGFCFSYFCLETKKNFVVIWSEDFPYYLIRSSGFKTGLLSELSFDFSIIHKITPEKRILSFILHGGLLLITFNDGVSQVRNLATKQIHFVPKSRLVNKYCFDKHADWEVVGLIIQFPSNVARGRCCFIVVRFCTRRRMMEVYCSVTRVWIKHQLKLDYELWSSMPSYLMNYVGFLENGVLSLYVLISRDCGLCGIAIKFKGPVNSEVKQYSFPLPEVVDDIDINTRIWECEKSLYLTYYNNTGLWIWRAGSTEADSWEWIPVFEISPVSLSCKPIAREHLSKAILNATGDRVMPLAFNTDVAVVYILMKSSLFAYNLNTDSLIRLGEVKDHEHMRLDYVFTFKPCLSFM